MSQVDLTENQLSNAVERMLHVVTEECLYAVFFEGVYNMNNIPYEDVKGKMKDILRDVFINGYKSLGDE